MFITTADTLKTTWSRCVNSGIGSWNKHAENRDQEITGMNINMHAISTLVNIPVCTSIEDIQVATREVADLQILK